MKAVMIHELGGTPAVQEIPAPVASDGEELIRVLAVPINAVDKSRVGGRHYSRPELPSVVGFVGAGEREDGRRVLFMHPAGAMAEQVAVDAGQLMPIPDDLDPAVAAAAFNPGFSAWWAVHYRGPVEPGSRVLIQGATGVTGRLAVQLARLRGAGYIVATGRNQAGLDELRELGADATIRVDQPDADLAGAYHAQEGQGWDLVIDYLWGHPTEIFLETLVRHDLEVRNLRVRLVQVGSMAGPTINLRSTVLRSAGLEIVGMGTGTAGEREHQAAAIRDFYELLRQGRLRVDIQRVPLTEVSEVWHQDQGGRRPVVIF